jgi:predicted HTH transcriptional regulator
MWCSPARLSPAGKFLVGLRRVVGDGGLCLVTCISFGFSNRSVQCFFGQKKKKEKKKEKKKKKKEKKRETCRETEKDLVIYVHDLNQMSVASCRCNEGRKKKIFKKRLSCPYYFGPLLAPYFGH